MYNVADRPGIVRVSTFLSSSCSVMFIHFLCARCSRSQCRIGRSHQQRASLSPRWQCPSEHLLRVIQREIGTDIEAQIEKLLVYHATLFPIIVHEINS